MLLAPVLKSPSQPHSYQSYDILMYVCNDNTSFTCSQRMCIKMDNISRVLTQNIALQCTTSLSRQLEI